jgi:hydrogenase/urease accessory protein HupE
MGTMRSLGRGLQVLGLVLPLTGLMLGEASTNSSNAMAYEFGFLALGAALFVAGMQLAKGR